MVGLSRLPLVRGWFSAHGHAMDADPRHKPRSCITCTLARDFLIGTCNKQLEILQWPRVLLVHEKRWQYNEVTKTCQKVDNARDFPATHGPIANMCYKLRSIVEHIGAAREGHYVARARDDRHG